MAVAATRKKWVASTLVLQVGPLPPALKNASDTSPLDPVKTNRLHYGITATRKVGGAVQRNRARRRLRALVFDIMVRHAKRDRAYVLVARSETIDGDWDALRRDLETALKRFHLWCEDASAAEAS